MMAVESHRYRYSLLGRLGLQMEVHRCCVARFHLVVGMLFLVEPCLRILGVEEKPFQWVLVDGSW
jgi:hypothetical protein